MTAFPLQKDVEYPESDGQPLGETGFHVDEMFDLLAAFRARFRGVPDVYVGGNMFLYYEEGNPRAVICPDVFVALGVSAEQRRIYKLWEEGRPPCLVIEITSDSTRREDLYRKKDCYARLGVDEYFLHDPLGDYLKPPIQGLRLVDGRYQPIEPGPDGSLESLATGVVIQQEGKGLRLTEVSTGKL
ncbi:MAG TPA: Uma2 family endonuclease, partial [Thermoanaerobaculia bacterium]|nr:Uma2 family endonuclease [Thermoanaerobaculia bacterium]